MRSSNHRVGRLISLLALGTLWVLTLQVFAESMVTEGSKAAGLDACVAPTPDMRRNHMEYIKHQRDRTVHQGIRGSRFSLADCVACHASVQNGHSMPVNVEGQFCQACHGFAAVSMDCFQCHRSTPETADVKLGFNKSSQESHLNADLRKALNAALEFSSLNAIGDAYTSLPQKRGRDHE